MQGATAQPASDTRSEMTKTVVMPLLIGLIGTALGDAVGDLDVLGKLLLAGVLLLAYWGLLWLTARPRRATRLSRRARALLNGGGPLALVLSPGAGGLAQFCPPARP